MSGATRKLFANGPTDATASPSSLVLDFTFRSGDHKFKCHSAGVFCDYSLAIVSFFAAVEL